MYAAVRRYEGIIDDDEAARLVRDSFMPELEKVPGFIAYYIVDGGDGKLASVSVFEEQAGADESTRRAAEWVADNLAELVEHAPLVLAGEVTVEARR